MKKKYAMCIFLAASCGNFSKEEANVAPVYENKNTVCRHSFIRDSDPMKVTTLCREGYSTHIDIKVEYDAEYCKKVEDIVTGVEYFPGGKCPQDNIIAECKSETFSFFYYIEDLSGIHENFYLGAEELCDSSGGKFVKTR